MAEPLPAGFTPFYNSMGGVEYLWRTRPEGGWDIAVRQDADPFLDMNRAMANENDGYSPSRDLRRAASIPIGVAMKWLIEEGLDIYDPDHGERLMRKLNDPDWRYLRTAPGILGPDGHGGFR